MLIFGFLWLGLIVKIMHLKLSVALSFEIQIFFFVKG